MRSYVAQSLDIIKSSLISSYDVYQHKDTHKYQAVKQGFCWPVFFVQSLWAFSRRLYLFGIFLTVLVIFVFAIELAIHPQGFWVEKGVSVFQLTVYAVIAFFANDVRRWFLKTKGYQKKASIEARWPTKAIRHYINSIDSQNAINNTVY